MTETPVSKLKSVPDTLAHSFVCAQPGVVEKRHSMGLVHAPTVQLRPSAQSAPSPKPAMKPSLATCTERGPTIAVPGSTVA